MALAMREVKRAPDSPRIADRVRSYGSGVGATVCVEVLFVGWVELAIPMRPSVMGIASLNPSYGAFLEL